MREVVAVFVEHRGDNLNARVAFQVHERIGRPALNLNRRLVLVFDWADNNFPLASGRLAVLREHLHTGDQRLITSKAGAQISDALTNSGARSGS